jgi:hypothetical protein
MAISRMNMERQMRNMGGIMGLEDQRQGYFLGKLVKKITKPIKKVIKSPLGKMALAGAALYGLGGAKFLGGQGIFSRAGPSGLARFANLKNLFLPAASNISGKDGLLRALAYNKDGTFNLGRAALSGLGATAIAAPFFMGGDEEEVDEESFTGPISSIEDIRDQARRYYSDPTNSALYFMPPKSAVKFGGAFAEGGLADIPREGYRVGGGVISMLQKAGGAMKNFKNNIMTKLSRMTDDVEISTTYDDAADTGPTMETMITAKSDKGKQILDSLVEEGIADVDGGVYFIKDFDEAMIGLQEGGIKASGAKLGTDKFTPTSQFETGPFESIEESMIRNLNKKAEGGIMDMGGLEKDYREGGFVPIGAEERADDVPARLSKNEFVFTADAVRNAGGGDIDKGAEVMQNMMDNLEAGGNISEESQGKENPAQAMFDQAQQLESRII